jgi:hypothetical protein
LLYVKYAAWWSVSQVSPTHLPTRWRLEEAAGAPTGEALLIYKSLLDVVADNKSAHIMLKFELISSLPAGKQNGARKYDSAASGAEHLSLSKNGRAGVDHNHRARIGTAGIFIGGTTAKNEAGTSITLGSLLHSRPAW